MSNRNERGSVGPAEAAKTQKDAGWLFGVLVVGGFLVLVALAVLGIG